MADNKQPIRPVPSTSVAPSSEEKVAFFDHQSGAFFRKLDWGAFWTTFLITFGVYCYTLAPTVTLEDSGELAVGSDYLGVPHPPGYPSWTLITWFFQWVFGWVRYYGNPNPAWGVALASAFFGSLACGILALLVSRSGTDMLRSMKKTTDVIGLSTESLLCWVGGVSGGLLLAFSPVLWSQSVIVEVYALNAFFQMILLLLTYMWMCRPKDDKLLFITAFLFGFGITNHQTLLFVGPALVAAIWFRDRALFRDCMAGLCICVAAYLFWNASTMTGNLSTEALRSKNVTTTLALLFLIAPVGLFLIERKLMTEWKRVLLIAGLCVLGLGFNGFMPISSDQNPPINWGYPRTPEGFKHALTRGQYEKITASDIFSAKFLAQLGAYFLDLKQQFTLPIAILGFAPFFFIGKIDRRGRTWLITSLVAFVSLSIVLITFQNPELDIQTLFIGRVQFIQSHAVYAIWLGYGVLFALTYLETLLGGRGVVKPLGLVAVAALPLTLLYQNAFDKEQIKIVGGAEQNQHDFGWQFGNWELQGVDGIRSDLAYKKTPAEFETIWKEYPSPSYPPPMETNAIFFGGTDPGRFVPTYMIYCAKVRSDVYLITQNALADNTYMNVMRDLYGDMIWIPSQQDSNFAFQKYVEDVQAGRIPAGADVQFDNGRVSVQGVQGVMMINGILCRMIFEANKPKHAFYVEESYVIPWMYPYLTPNGLIMKLNSEPINALPAEMVKNDRDFWDWYTRRLLGNPKFLRDVVARKTFSKLRGAIAGIYAFRRMYPEAEYAFQQAIDLYPLSPEANFRLADVFMQQRRFADAGKLIETFLREDPGNTKVGDFLNQIRDTEKADARRTQLESQFNQGQGDLNTAMELADLYRKLNMEGQFQGLTMNILNDTNVPPNAYLAVAKMYADAKRADLLATALEKYLAREPSNPKVWIDLAAIQAAMQKTSECMKSLKQAVDLGGEPARDILRKDARFTPVRDTPEFKSLVPPIQQQNLPMGLPDLPML